MSNGQLRGVLWNAQAFFTVIPTAHRGNVVYVTQLLKGNDFLAISEALVSEGEKAAFRSPAGTRAFWSVGSARSAGKGLIARESSLGNFNEPTRTELWPGRAARLSLAGPPGGFVFCGGRRGRPKAATSRGGGGPDQGSDDCLGHLHGRLQLGPFGRRPSQEVPRATLREGRPQSGKALKGESPRPQPDFARDGPVSRGRLDRVC